jgi:hypothetical protein
MGDYEVLGFESLRNALPCIVSGNLVITKREKREKEKRWPPSSYLHAPSLSAQSSGGMGGGQNIPVVSRMNH